ncbi:MAG: hypothetical protein KC503_31050 [Myxococcales bacterium]|nr:hypothetical protein [Myxococcales bacterium]
MKRNLAGRGLSVALLLVCVGGCDGRPVGPGSGGGSGSGVGSGGGSGAAGDIGLDSITRRETRKLYEPSSGKVLQGSWPLQLLWLGDHYALLYRENVSGKLALRVRMLDAAGAPLGEPLRVNDAYDKIEDAPDSGRLVARDAALAILWTNERREIVFRPLDARSGQPLAAAHVAVSGVGPNATINSAVPTADGYAIAWSDNRAGGYRYLPYFARLDAKGVAAGSGVKVASGSTPEQYPRVGALAGDGDGDGFALTWSEREASAEDRLYVSYLAADGAPRGEATLLYRADNVIVTGDSLVDHRGVRVVALWDLDVGAGLLTIGAEKPVWPAPLADVERLRLVRAADNTVAVLGGSDSTPGKLPGKVFFALVDPRDGRTGSATALGGETSGSCVEGYDIARASDGFGVVWIEGCSVRRLYFARLH